MGQILSKAQVKSLFPKRDENSNKSDYGYIALIGGCVKYSGAIRLAALANSCMRSGAGVCTVAAPKSLTDAVLPQILESTFFPLSDDEGNLVFHEEEFGELCRRNSVIAFGMGIGNTEETQKALRYLLENFDGTLIVDADGINAMAKLGKKTLQSHRGKLVLTPHPKEFSRLAKRDVKDVLADPEGSAEGLAKFLDAVVLLKGHVTTVSDGEMTYLVERGGPGMATAGSGDVLAGILAAVLACHKDNLLIATAGAAYINGLAGEIAQDENGEVSQVASDTAKCVQKAIQQITEHKSLDTRELANFNPDKILEQPKQKEPRQRRDGSVRRTLRVMVLVLFFVAGGLSAYFVSQNGLPQKNESEALDTRAVQADYVETMNFLMKDIYIDGKLVNNYQLRRPLGMLNNRIYIPLTEEIEKALGIRAEWQGAHPKDIFIYRDEASHEGAFYSLNGWNLINITGWAKGNVTLHLIDPEDESEEVYYPDVSEIISYNDGEVMYIPLAYLKLSKIMPVSAFYDPVGGLYISTDEDCPAEGYFSANNYSYIMGRAEYMKTFRKEMTVGDLTVYEYIFRHEANTYEVDEDLMLSIARTESKFNIKAGSSAGAKGIMQIMPSTGKNYGLTVDDLYQLHPSVQFGSMYIRDALKNFKGNTTKALSAYNFGGGAVLSGAYNTSYANTVLSRKKSMEAWIENQGYSNVFLTEVECIK